MWSDDSNDALQFTCYETAAVSAMLARSRTTKTFHGWFPRVTIIMFQRHLMERKVSLFDWVFHHAKWVEDQRKEAEAKVKQQEELARQHQHVQDVQRDWLSTGRQLTMICGRSDVGLHTDERLICVLPGSEMYEPHAVRVYHGGSRGTSIRVAKGLSFRVGASVGQSESHDELRLLDTGTFIITSERVVFCGSMRTLSMPFEQILGTEMFSDGLRINTEKRAKPCTFGFDTTLSTVLDGATFFATGQFISCILDQAKVLAHRPTNENPADFMKSVAIKYIEKRA
jgi:hypothetical protein